ncbi:uncharacterized protein LOC121794038 [Salvia splendens]|uniref:uncharacterized protein LOC121794038 n=1 Tax=Salvia splendens TaxID=180675 RepID=UPI001C26BFC4|nr:uncharacterized protein LOC121794038 [Salvia splendens]
MSEIDEEEEEKEICSYVTHLERAFNKPPRTTRVNGWNEKDMFRLPTNEVVEELNRAFVMIEIISFNTQLTHNNPLAPTTSRGWDKRHQNGNASQELDVSLSHMQSILAPKIPRARCIIVTNAVYVYFHPRSQEMDVSLSPMRSMLP